MPMQTSTKERIYLLIMVFSLMLCAVLLISVFCDLPVATVSASAETHIPAMRAWPPQGGGAAGTPAGAETPATAGVIITEEALSAQITALLPVGFPMSEIGVDIEARGAMGLELELQRAGLKDYLESLGVQMGARQSLALSLLPDTLAVEAVLALSQSADGAVGLQLESVRVEDRAVEVDFLPPSLFEVLGSAVQAALSASGTAGQSITFGDGVLYVN